MRSPLKHARLARIPLPPAPAFDAEDWQAAFDERAGVLEFDGGFPRHEAERRAREEITALYGPEPGTGHTTDLTEGKCCD